MKFGIAQKIFLGIILIITFFFVIAVMSIITLNNNRKTLSEISTIIDPTLQGINDFSELLFTSEKNLTKLFTNASDVKAVSNLTYINDIEFAKVKNNLILLQNQLKNDEVRETINSSIADFEKICLKIRGSGDLNSLDSSNRAALALTYYSEYALSYAELISRLQKSSEIVKQSKSQLEEELLKRSENLRAYIIILAFVLVLSGIFMSIYISYAVIGSIKSIKEFLVLMSRGELPEFSMKRMSDEIGEIQEAIAKLITGLKKTTVFANNIGKGELDAEFVPLSQSDTLGQALLDMRRSLKIAAAKDDEQNLIVSSIADVSTILNTYNNLEELGDKLIQYLCKKVDAVQGAFYIIEDDEKSGQKMLQLQNAFAYNRKKYLSKSFKIGEGLVGQAVAEMDLIHRTEIPKEYISIKSGLLGDKKPQSILIMPLITNENVYGAIEFASIYKFTSQQILLIREISEIIARSIFNVQVNDRTRKLLDASQKMSGELKEQSIMLQQNAEEMQATQEELKRTNLKLEEQINEVSKSQKKIHVLLENSQEVIYICDDKGYISYVSPSIHSIAGYDQEDLMWKDFEDNVNIDHQTDFEKMLEGVAADISNTATLEYIYRKKNGEEIWMEATAKNLIKDESIGGIVINSRDITVRKLAEKESRMRSQMQSLSENSPDLICRINTKGKFYYVNPVIEKLTGKPHSDFNQKFLQETELNEGVVKDWQSIIQSVMDQKEKINREINFPTTDGLKVMSVNAIPEFGEDSLLESILLVSNDITERKQAEVEIQTKNKKITESINYAQRIQKAILPDNNLINQHLPQSFILYKAKDVVSGDFPWFLKIDQYIYIAAVDCTGHGVPGALLSLIGYFILNDVVNSGKYKTTGEILDALDRGVTQTLRQDVEGSETKDGMDIAFVKINTETNEVEYSGAHRPLFAIKGGEFLEFKGDKFPIGGGIYRNQTNFVTHKVKLNVGDSIYFCSDGYPDQFGGPENRKLSPARIRNLINENPNTPMNQMNANFDKLFEDWKVGTKQTDDVLLIGIKF